MSLTETLPEINSLILSIYVLNYSLHYFITMAEAHCCRCTVIDHWYVKCPIEEATGHVRQWLGKFPQQTANSGWEKSSPSEPGCSSVSVEQPGTELCDDSEVDTRGICMTKTEWESLCNAASVAGGSFEIMDAIDDQSSNSEYQIRQDSTVKVAHHYYIRAGATKIIKIQVSPELTGWKLLDPYPMEGIYMSQTLFNADQGGRIRISNNSDHGLPLIKGHVLGTVSEVDYVSERMAGQGHVDSSSASQDTPVNSDLEEEDLILERNQEGSNSPQRSSNPLARRYPCHACGEIGHLRAECLKRKRKRGKDSEGTSNDQEELITAVSHLSVQEDGNSNVSRQEEGHTRSGLTDHKVVNCPHDVVCQQCGKADTDSLVCKGNPYYGVL